MSALPPRKAHKAQNLPDARPTSDDPADMRRSYQRHPSGLLETSTRHPVTGARVRLTGHSPEALLSRKRYLVDLRKELGGEGASCPHCGGALAPRVTPAAAAELADLATHEPRGRVLLARAWEAMERTAPPEHRAKLESVYRHQIEPFFPASIALVDLSRARVARWHADLAREGYAPKTIRCAHWFLAAAYNRQAARGAVPRYPPWGELAPPRAVPRRTARALTRAELEALLHAADPDLARRIAVLALTGLRNAEAAALGWDHLDLERGTMTVSVQALDQWARLYPHHTRPSAPTKGRRAHVQHLHPQARGALEAQRAALERAGAYRPDGPVFPERLPGGGFGTWRKNGNTLTPNALATAARAAGLSWRPTAHTLRHTFVSLELAGGLSALETQQRVGHASVRTTEAYAHARGVQSAIAPLHWAPSSDATEEGGPRNR